jgi:cobyric acid synthase CobQ
VERVSRWRSELQLRLASIPGLAVYPSEANFLLCRLESGGSARELGETLLRDHCLMIRNCENFAGLDERYFRVAVREPGKNDVLVRSLQERLGPGGSGMSGDRAMRREMPQERASGDRTPAVMFQGLSSNAGKSVMAAALCRIFLQDGHRVVPFKAQNMSLNSFVTREGGEMGRAQALQAQACRLDPDVRMNPVLLKPSTDTGSQVIVRGRPVGTMDVRTYHGFKEEAAAEARRAYDEIAGEADVVVLEGAGSPAEINLRDHDLTNMAMALHARASVLLVGDIDRGGVFASFVGTMELLEPHERELVAGYVINRFRGDETLLDPAIEHVAARTAKPFLGVVPYLSDLGLPEEDSVTFKSGWDRRNAGKEGAPVRIVCLDLPHISNFTDLEPFLEEPDVRLEVARSPDELAEPPDVLVLPGSKNTLSDLRHVQESGAAGRIRRLAGEGTEIVGVCGGFQMLGTRVADPLGIESGAGAMDALGLLPLVTELGREKHLHQVRAVHRPSGSELKGYEIHHGNTRIEEGGLECVVASEDGREIGFARPGSLVWGTYLHGLFDEDAFRRVFIDQVRRRKGLAPLREVQARYDLEERLDRLAEVVRSRLDMESVYRLIGLKRP